MKKVIFKTVEITGFGVFVDRCLVELKDIGRVLIIGENNDSDSASSNGSGKTTIFKAISWACFGQTIDGLTTNVTSIQAEKAQVRLWFSVNEEHFRITRTRGATSGTLKLEQQVPFGGTWEDRSQGIRETQASLNSLLGMDWDAFRCICLFGQGDVSRFASPGMTDTARKAVLNQVLNLSRYDKARDGARGVKAALQADLSTLENERNKTKSKAETAKALIDVRTSDLDDSAGFIESVDEQREEAIASFDMLRLSFVEVDLSEIEAAKSEAEEGVQELEELVEAARDALSTSKSSLDKAESALRSAETNECSKCLRPFEVSEETLQKANKAVSKAKKKVARSKEILDELKDELSSARVVVAGHEKKIARAASEKREHESALASATRELEGLEGRVEKEKERASKLLREISEHKKTVKGSKKEIADFDAKITAITSKISAANWWINGFGPKGVQAYAIEQALPALNAATNKHLLSLSDGDLSVCWSATTTGTSGTEKEQLTCDVVIEGTEGAAPSGGQWRKIELATEIALSEVVKESGGTDVNLLMLDEALDGLDEQGSARVCEWLDELDYESIMVVSHTHTISDSFDTIICVCKEDGKARIEND